MKIINFDAQFWLYAISYKIISHLVVRINSIFLVAADKPFECMQEIYLFIYYYGCFSACNYKLIKETKGENESQISSKKHENKIIHEDKQREKN